MTEGPGGGRHHKNAKCCRALGASPRAPNLNPTSSTSGADDWLFADLESYKAAACGSLSGAIAGAATTPFDVIKTRLMLIEDSQGVRYKGVVDVARRVVVEEGASKLLAGLAPRVMWISIGGFVFFGSCEFFKKLLNGRLLGTKRDFAG